MRSGKRCRRPEFPLFEVATDHPIFHLIPAAGRRTPSSAVPSSLEHLRTGMTQEFRARWLVEPDKQIQTGRPREHNAVHEGRPVPNIGRTTTRPSSGSTDPNQTAAFGSPFGIDGRRAFSSARAIRESFILTTLIVSVTRSQ
jgi:hypothetical protein